MILSKVAISLLCLLLLLSIFVANLMNSIATNHNIYTEDKSEGENYTKRIEKKYGKITDTSANLIWFLQISDIHISIFRDPGRISQFQQFCDSTVKKINPLIVLATGDLTDAKAKDNIGSSQVKTEWIYYYNIIKESGVTVNSVWLDIRGNHDNFNIKTINSQENYFRNYSVQGAVHPKSYVHFEHKNGVKVAFLGIDACPDPGLRRPFNFIGILDEEEQTNILKLQAEADSKADHIVWYGHYPTSCILSLEKDSQRMDLRNTIGNSRGSQAYLCGHLHTMGGLVKEMYTKQKRGFLELELGDWKDNRMYRLAAIDHGIFSFVDQKHNSWPVVLVTNPKNVQFSMPWREPLGMIPESSHIRILAFSDVSISNVQISFDKVSWEPCKHTSGPLYTAKWFPQQFKTGLHTLYVAVIDEAGKEAMIEHSFSLDGTLTNYPVSARILLMLEAGFVFQTVFSTLFLLNIIPLVILRFQRKQPRESRTFGRHVLRRIWLLTKIDRLYYTILFYSIYIPIGPWAVGELIDGQIGTVFAWGILIQGVYLPEPFTYVYGGVQLMFVQIPLVIVLAYTVEDRLYGLRRRGLRGLVKNLPIICLLTIQFVLAYFFWLEYGTMAFLFGPLRTWSILLSLMLWYQASTLPPEYCRKLISLTETSPT